MILLTFLLAGSATASEVLQDLIYGFKQPPPSARPWVYWFWLNGNVSREGITADLESMQRVGLGGAILLDVTSEVPAGPVRFDSAEWHELLRHAVREAGRLGLQLVIHNAPGWSGSGGPWVTPDLAMQKVVSSRTNLNGPGLFEGRLAELSDVANPSHDIATLAFPALVSDGAPLPGFKPTLTCDGAPGFDGMKLLDGKSETICTIPAPTKRKPQLIQAHFAEPFTISWVKLAGARQAQSFQGTLQVSDDGHHFRVVREFGSKGNGIDLRLDQISAHDFRLVFTHADESLAHLTFSELVMAPEYRIPLYQAKTGLGPLPARVIEAQSVPSCEIIPLNRVVDLTGRVDARGRLSWEVPAGIWTVLRLGYRPVGTRNHPAPAGGEGLECDKLSKEAVEFHFKSYLERLLAETRTVSGPGIAGTFIESWEVGFQNWTPDFPREFRARRGYDPLPYLPVFTGRYVDGVENSERFLWDVRRTVADLVADNYAGHLAELAHREGLNLFIEAYGNGPLDTLQYAAQADVPMGEFWAETDDFSRFHHCSTMSWAAHTWGKPIIAAEAFTAHAAGARWLNHPFTLKPLGDAAFCAGVNRLVIHRFAHQPWLNRRPGMTMSYWGLQYERTETWWEQSKPWHDYLARCQFLLQRGLFVADVCYLSGETAYFDPPSKDHLQPSLPSGFDCDMAAPDVVLSRMEARGHELVLPDGMSYRVLVLPPSGVMTPRLVRKLTQLAQAGATILGPPPLKSPSLSDYPRADSEVQELAREFWGTNKLAVGGERNVGAGKVFWNKPLEEVLRRLNVAPDFQQLTPSPSSGHPLRSIHRRIDGTDIYFVCNSNPQPVQVECAFRVIKRRPEFWHPDTGEVEKVARWSQQPERTIMPIKLGPAGSVFVVFNESSEGIDPVSGIIRNGRPDRSAEVTLGPEHELQLLASNPGNYDIQLASGKIVQTQINDLPERIALEGPWHLRVPDTAAASTNLVLQRLVSLTELSMPHVKYFSGTVTYSNHFLSPAGFHANTQRLYLDLGRVEVIAVVRVNEHDFGVFWKPPFEIDVTSALRSTNNSLEIEVVNLWPNRMIGDEQLPADCHWGPWTESGARLLEWPDWLLEGKSRATERQTFATWKHWTKDSPLLPSGLLGPVTLRVAELRRLPR